MEEEDFHSYGASANGDNFCTCSNHVMVDNHFFICFRSKDNVKLVAVKNVRAVSSPDLHVSDLETIPYHLKENQLAKNAAPGLDRTG